MQQAPAPLTGVRVLEFPQAVAAPVAGRLLAELGADVIRVENPLRLDSIRRFGSGWLPASVPREVAGDTRPSLSTLNAGKRSLALDLSLPEGVALIRRLAERTDVVVANLSAGVLPALGLGYEDLRRLRPDVVYCSLPAFGNRPGPYRDFKTWGPNLSALAGLDHLTGWPDRPPCGLGSIAYVDFLVGATAAAAVLAAILERDLSGEGAFLDVSQHEVAVAVLGSELMAQASGAGLPRRSGNRSPSAAPHGIYPTRGDDRWLAIAVRDDREWRALCSLAAGEPFAGKGRFETLQARLAEVERLDDDLAAWTYRYPAAELAERLRARGVEATSVLDLADLATDPQLESRGFFRLLPHARFGRDLVAGSALRVEGSPEAGRAGPCLGEDSAAVLEEVLGLDAHEVEGLSAAGVIYEMRQWERLERPYARWARYLMPQAGWER